MAKFSGILALALLAGCATVEPVVAFPTTDPGAIQEEIAFEQEASLDRLRQQDGRVAEVSFRLNVANLELCAARALLPGMTMHHALQYGRDIRPVAIRHFHMTGRPSVLTVAPGGPADKAGVKVGDILVAVDGDSFADLGDQLSVEAPTYDDTLRARVQLDRALADGAAAMTVERGGQRLTLNLVPVAGCAYEAQLVPSEDPAAWADGQGVFITTAMVRYVATDDQLAVVLGHELGHNVLKHRMRISRSGAAAALLGNGGTTREGLLTVEREADYVGLYLMARAGYNYATASDFWRQFGADYGLSRYAQWSHPGSLERAASLTTAADEIRGKLAAGRPLTPTAAWEAPAKRP